MSFNPLHIWASMGMMSKFIAACLLLMAVISLAVTVERFIALVRGQGASQAFAKLALPLMEKRSFAEIAKLADGHEGAPLARMVGPAIKKFVRHADEKDGELSPVELARREAARRSEAVGAELRRGLSILASVGSIAPFVGLLGTVVGIITAFQGIAITGSGGLGAVSAGIAEALVETALGLMVAIPVVLLFNYLTGKVNGVEAAMNRSVSELIDEMENVHGHGSRGYREKAA